MKVIKLTTGTWGLEEVPEDAKHFATHFIDAVQKLVFESEIQDPCKCGGDMLRLPPGNWSIVGKADELTEDVWEKIAGLDLTYEYSSVKVYSKWGSELLETHDMTPKNSLILKLEE